MSNVYMTRFIMLTSRVINKSHIVEIVKHPNGYNIHMSSNNYSGLFLFSFGMIFNKPKIIEIYNKKDYDIITEFIKNEFK